MDSHLIEKLVRMKESLVLAIVTGVSGSAPRHSGSSMLVASRGIVGGSVGGGRGEAIALKEMEALLLKDGSKCLEIDMLEEGLEDQGMICGGQSHMFFKSINKEDRAIFEAIDSHLKAGDPVEMAWDVREGKICHWKVLDLLSGRTLKPRMDSQKVIFYDIILPREQLLLLGAGYVSQALYTLARTLDFDITVVDERPSFANRDRFKEAAHIIAKPWKEALETYPFNHQTYIVVASKSHKDDQEALSCCLNQPKAYIGCIGSKKKLKAVKEGLVKRGFSLESIQSIYGPIGLSIGAETPEEIGVSILAQIIGVKHGKESQLSEK